jgi:hypothetical protein
VTPYFCIEVGDGLSLTKFETDRIIPLTVAGDFLLSRWQLPSSWITEYGACVTLFCMAIVVWHSLRKFRVHHSVRFKVIANFRFSRWRLQSPCFHEFGTSDFIVA